MVYRNLDPLASSLAPWGLDADVLAAFKAYQGPGQYLGRVILEHRGEFLVMTERGEQRAKARGKLMADIRNHKAERPAVGDWVVFDHDPETTFASVFGHLPRKSKLSRKAAGRIQYEQVIASNVDTVFIVTALGTDINPRRIERYLSVVREGGAAPALVLSKSDLGERLDAELKLLQDAAPGVPVHIVSGLLGLGTDTLNRYLINGHTVAFVGSSGVGKSTLINALLGQDVHAVSEIGRDGRGRHTTVARHLTRSASGALIMDTPGMRELGLWESVTGPSEALGEVFQDIAEAATTCRFRNCAHHKEPGCAVRKAVAAGDIPNERLESFLKLAKEKKQRARPWRKE